MLPNHRHLVYLWQSNKKERISRFMKNSKHALCVAVWQNNHHNLCTKAKKDLNSADGYNQHYKEDNES